MIEEPLFKEVQLTDIFSQDYVSKPLLLILSPNYERRSIFVSEEIKKFAKKRKVKCCVLCLLNDNQNDSILEGQKYSYIEKLCKNLDIKIENCNWLQYPNGFILNGLETLLKENLQTFNSIEPFDILVDVSAIPRSIIFYICELLNKLIKNRLYNIKKILFAYVTPKRYSAVHYAQDIGILYGFFSGRSLKSNSMEGIHSIIFPSRTGHEGKLLLDDLRQMSCGEQVHTIYFPIDRIEFTRSMELMRANQILLEKEDYVQRYYCSISDALIDLHKLLYDEVKKLDIQSRITQDRTKKCLYLIAPFGAKIFLPTAYFELQKMKESLPELIDIEICHAKGFQYTSVYSLGVGQIQIFEMEIKNDKS